MKSQKNPSPKLSYECVIVKECNDFIVEFAPRDEPVFVGVSAVGLVREQPEGRLGQTAYVQVHGDKCDVLVPRVERWRAVGVRTLGVYMSNRLILSK